MFDHYRSAVAEFHRAMRVPYWGELNRHERMALAALRAELISEEGQEVRAADEAFRRDGSARNRENLAKEVGDLLYVTVGSADLFHTPMLDPATRTEQTIPPFFAEGAVMQQAGRVIDSLNLLVHQVDIGWSDFDLAREIEEIGSELQNLADSIADMAAAYNWIPLQAVFDAVHASNMSKLNPETGLPEFREDGKVLKGPGYHKADLSFLTQDAA